MEPVRWGAVAGSCAGCKQRGRAGGGKLPRAAGCFGAVRLRDAGEQGASLAASSTRPTLPRKFGSPRRTSEPARERVLSGGEREGETERGRASL